MDWEAELQRECAARGLTIRAEEAEEEADILEEQRDAACQAYDELDRAEWHLTAVAYRLALELDIAHEALRLACGDLALCHGANSGGQWVPIFMRDAKAVVAARWTRPGLVGGWVFDDAGNVQEIAT